MNATNAIDISSPRLLPKGELIGPMSEAELERVFVKGRLFRLTHTAPKAYREYFIEPSSCENEEAK